MEATAEVDFCSSCGFHKTIVATGTAPRVVDGKQVGTRELKYCASCSGSTKFVDEALRSLQPGLVDATEQIKPSWDAAAAAREQQVYLGWPLTVHSATGSWRQFTKKPIAVWVRGPIESEEYIDTLEGRMHASPGDYVIRGVNGELYPCKPAIFKKTYEQAGVLKAKKVPKTVSDEVRHKRDLKYFARGALFAFVLLGIAALFALHYLGYL